MSSREGIYEKIFNCLERYAELMSAHDCSPECIDLLKENMSYYVSSNCKYQQSEKLLSSAMNNLNNATNQEESSKVCKTFEENIKGIKVADGTADPRYIKFLNTLDKDNEADEDIRMVTSARNVIDPISKQRMVDPVKNTQCGHTYEKQFVFALIQKNPRTRCPIPGCEAKEYIQRKHLIPDLELKRYLEATVPCDNEVSANDSKLISLDDTR